MKAVCLFSEIVNEWEGKRSLGLTMYDAPNATEELKQPRKRPPKEKVEAIIEVLKYLWFRGL